MFSHFTEMFSDDIKGIIHDIYVNARNNMREYARFFFFILLADDTVLFEKAPNILKNLLSMFVYGR